jgi:hypothetical protein
VSTAVPTKCACGTCWRCELEVVREWRRTHRRQGANIFTGYRARFAPDTGTIPALRKVANEISSKTGLPPNDVLDLLADGREPTDLAPKLRLA